MIDKNCHITMINWLIEYKVFYAVSGIFRPYNGGPQCLTIYMIKKTIKILTQTNKPKFLYYMILLNDCIKIDKIQYDEIKFR